MKRGLVISISGVDGTGKTTQAALLIKYLRHRGYRCVYSHVRFGHFFSVPLLALARIGGFTRIYRTAQGTQVGIHFFGKSKALASLYPITFYIDTAINMALKVHLHTLFGRIVVADRFVYDALVDLMVSTGKTDLLRSTVGRLLLRLVPKTHMKVGLSLPPALLRYRREELEFDVTLDERQLLFTKVTEELGIPIISTEGSIGAIHNLILEKLWLDHGRV